jgi:tetratricopeptide (TPR) repeat protein
MFLAFGCSFSYSKLEYERAKQSAEKENFPEALKHFDRVVKKDPNSPYALESARQAARISLLETKDYKQAIEYLRYLILHSPVASERMNAQKKLAGVYFENLQKFSDAIEEYNKLLSLDPPRNEAFTYRFNIAKSYFQLNNFYQTEIELDALVEKYKEPDKQFNVMLFKGNVYLTTKEHDKAIKTFQSLIEKFPKKANQENVGLSLAAVYEDLQQFDKAVEILKELRMSEKSPEFIDLKIKRLQERAQNLPGAQGFKK